MKSQFYLTKVPQNYFPDLPQDLTMAFLTIFNAEANSRKNFEWNGMNFEFNFKQQTFIFATTRN